MVNIDREYVALLQAMDISKISNPFSSFTLSFMKNTLYILSLFVFIFIPAWGISQEDRREPLYFPGASVEDQLAEAMALAEADGKHVLLQIGGNWCVWCYRFHDFVSADTSLSALMDEAYVTVHINYSKENMNEDWLAQWGYPQRFGFPVFVVLNAEGQRLHTQNSAYLESEKSYDAKATKAFLQHWSKTALSPESYE